MKHYCSDYEILNQEETATLIKKQRDGDTWDYDIIKILCERLKRMDIWEATDNIDEIAMNLSDEENLHLYEKDECFGVC